jgi:hypothetical protein
LAVEHPEVPGELEFVRRYRLPVPLVGNTRRPAASGHQRDAVAERVDTAKPEIEIVQRDLENLGPTADERDGVVARRRTAFQETRDSGEAPGGIGHQGDDPAEHCRLRPWNVMICLRQMRERDHGGVRQTWHMRGASPAGMHLASRR